MYALLVEYGPHPASIPPLAVRWAYRDLLARLPGYRRRLELQADSYRRLVDLFLFATDTDARAALASPERRAFASAHPACAAASLALLVREGSAWGDPVILLRRTRPTSPAGSQLPWRDRLYPASPATELW